MMNEWWQFMWTLSLLIPSKNTLFYLLEVGYEPLLFQVYLDNIQVSSISIKLEAGLNKVFFENIKNNSWKLQEKEKIDKTL